MKKVNVKQFRLNSNFHSKTAQRKCDNYDDESLDGANANQQDKLQPYFVENQVAQRVIIPIDSAVREAAYYRLVCSKIEEMSENDTVEFHINSPGGDLSGLTSLLHSISSTEAETIAVITGDCHSAASLLALSCDAVVVGRFANMLVHSVQFGTHGKGYDVYSQVLHINKHAEDIFKSCYRYFLTEQEMQEVLKGRELWLSRDEINQRLTVKYETIHTLQKEAEQGCCGNPEGCDDICACPLAQDCN